MSKQRLLVIGNGMVGQRFLEELVAKTEAYDITVIGEEIRPAYDRVQLSAWFSGTTVEELTICEENFFHDNGITFLTGTKAVSINRTSKIVKTDSGMELPYDTLVLATGSYPFVPPIPGNDKEHCHVYRTIEDLEAIQASASSSQSGVVIGGGLLGLEAAKALKDSGLVTHVVEFAPQLMAVQLDEIGGALLREKIEALDVRVHTAKATQNIGIGTTARYRLNFEEGDLETDMVVFSAGIRPRDELARSSGLSIGERGGVIIDDHCKTSDDSIYAIGEVALWQGKIYGLVAPGYEMARNLASTLTDEAKTFSGADMSTKLKLLGVEVGSIGDAHARTEGARICSISDASRGVYKKLIISNDGKKLLGAVLVGDTGDYDSLLQYSLNDIDLPDEPISLISPQSGDKPVLGVDALPATAQICSCNNVSKGDICASIAAGCTTMGAIKSETRASSTCGGCTTLVKQVLDAELKSQGIEVNNDICEHFSYTRQGLYHLVRMHEIRSFEE